MHKSVSFTPHIVLICALQFNHFLRLCLSPRTTHAQSPFLFPIGFSINLIPFFDVCSVPYLLFFHPGCSGMFCYVLLYLGRCAIATVAVCGFGSWSLVFHCGMPRQISPLPQWDVCKSPGFPSNRVAAGQVDPPAVRITMVCSLFAGCLSASEAFLFLSGAVCWVFSNAYTKEEHLLVFFRG